MGCLQSVACKARVRREHIVVSDVSATIEPAATAIEESSPVVLRYRTPYFRASARVLMPPIARRHTWVVGWIQACNHMEFYNTYSDLGVSSWELPDLREGRVKAISDSDGVSYPWYGNTTETVTLVGPTNKISRFSGSVRSRSTIKPCLWQMLLSTPLAVEEEPTPARCGGLVQSPFPLMSLPMHFGSIISTLPCLLGLGKAWEQCGSWCPARAQCLHSSLPERAFLQLTGSGTFCMRLGVFGVVVTVGDDIVHSCLGVRPEGRLDIL
ncbi:protein FAM78B isoform X1 [Cyrtonyx montezumae]|uniref:protein FAM78B isoform X1 n=1 Tax=Cyrtonyx montezumae TaxID=9017 RepID=UPI0032DA24CD